MRSQRNIGWAGAALLFGLCGAASSLLSSLGHSSNWGNGSLCVLPVPFGVVAAWLCVESAAAGVALVALDAAVWQLAFLSGAVVAEGAAPQPVLGMCLAGFLGGLGVSLAAALCQRREPARRSLGISAFAGAVCGLPFAWSVVFENRTEVPAWATSLASFVLWQAVVGVCLWHGFRLGKPGPAARTGAPNPVPTSTNPS
jgi:hypothetical protein